MAKKSTFAILFTALLTLFGCAKDPQLGVKDGQLSMCPSSPNCVSSQQSKDDKHYIEPLVVKNTHTEIAQHDAIQLLVSHISEMDGVIIIAKPDYVHAIFSSNFWGFKDDLECYISGSDPEGNFIVQIRSAARTGYYDFNVNRERVEELRNRIAQ